MQEEKSNEIDPLAMTIRLDAAVGGEAADAADEEAYSPVPETMPPLPPAGQVDRLKLSVGTRSLTFFTARTLTFGRARPLCDITLSPSSVPSQRELDQHRKVSREHCLFEQRGNAVFVQDGHRNGYRVMQSSTGGTYADGRRLTAPCELTAGNEILLTFGGDDAGAALALRACVVPAGDLCAHCPLDNRNWCGAGRRPSLVLTRADGLHESFVALWGCLDLGVIDPALIGTVVFRKDGGFGWRHAGNFAWLVPGRSLATELGSVGVSAL